MNRKTRDRRLTPEEAERSRVAREQVAAELPELIARHHARGAAPGELRGLLAELKAAREAQGLSLADLAELTDMDRATLSELEDGRGPDPTFGTLARYAESVGRRLVVALVGDHPA